jgi:hypothetical protein
LHSSELFTNITPSDNLQGRSSLPAHRVLRKVPTGLRLKARDAAHVGLLQAEGANVDDAGNLTSLEKFWDFSSACDNAYRDNVASATAVAPRAAHSAFAAGPHASAAGGASSAAGAPSVERAGVRGCSGVGGVSASALDVIMIDSDDENDFDNIDFAFHLQQTEEGRY